MIARQKAQVISTTQITILAFATAFFPRILDLLGAPAAINFVHFVLVPTAFLISVLKCRVSNKEQTKTIQSLVLGLYSFFIVILTSAFVNRAGLINAILSFMLLAEPYLLLTTILALSFSPKKLLNFKKWFYRFFFTHLALVYIQKYILRVDTWDWLGMVAADRIQGVFLLSGAGHVVGSSVSLTFAIYYFFRAKKCLLWLRYLVVLAAIWNIVISDGKQALLAFMVAMILLFLARLNNVGLAMRYVIAGIILGSLFWWSIENISAFSAFNTWIRPEIYGPDGEATLLKTTSLRIIPTHYKSILNWLFGLGPGHTVGRLGGFMLVDYDALLRPLGSTIHPVSKEIWRATGASWLGDKSSMFSPLFGWAGIWGDLGIAGLAGYFYLASIVWKNVCNDDLMRFFLLTVFVFGCIYTQLEEPGYMLSIASIIGLEYQKYLVSES